MKCPACKNGVMKRGKDAFHEDGIDFDLYLCPSCGEEIMTMDQLKDLAEKYRKLRAAKEVTFARWGNSVAVRIPTDVAQEYHLTAGKHGLLTKEKHGFKIVLATLP